MVRTITDIEGIEYISYLDSWLVWRKLTNNWAKIYQLTSKTLPSGKDLARALSPNSETCLFCGGSKSYNDVRYGRIYCICAILQFQYETAIEMNSYRSFTGQQTLANLDLSYHSDVQIMHDQAINFIEHLDNWLILMGKPGVGKSHTLQAIANALGPIALYIAASDFEATVFDGIENNTLKHFIDTIKRAPILLFDDLGSEYGSAFTKAKLMQVIDFRYSMWKEFPTVVATNFSPSALQKYDGRIASRLRDRDISIVVGVSAPDYRVHIRG